MPSSATSELSPLSLHDALPISDCRRVGRRLRRVLQAGASLRVVRQDEGRHHARLRRLPARDRQGSPRGRAGRRARELPLSLSFRRSEEHTSELQSHHDLVCRLLPPPSYHLFPYTTLFRSLIAGVWGGDYVAFYKQALRYGLFDKMKVATTLAFGGYPHAIGKDHPEGVLAGVHANYHFLYPSAERWPINKSFVERYHKRWKEYPSFESDGAYTALYLYKQAVEKANQLVGGWPDDEAVIAMLEGTGIDAPAGYLYLRADNHQGYKDAVTGLSKNLPGYDFPVWDPASIVSIPIRSITAPPNWPKPGQGHNESTAAADWIKKTWPAAAKVGRADLRPGW